VYRIDFDAFCSEENGTGDPCPLSKSYTPDESRERGILAHPGTRSDYAVSYVDNPDETRHVWQV
jgi:hypothetical protein